jgi:hypothetical protein
MGNAFRLAGISAFILWSAGASVALAEPEATVVARPVAHEAPRLKVSYRLFSLAGLDGGAMWLHGAQLDAYVVSRRWLRIGLELEGGGGSASLAGTGAMLRYGLLGVTAGVQYPARVTPFVEGRFAGGVLSGALDGALTVGATTYTGSTATTWMYGGGLESGVEVYVYKRAYLSAALGWMHTTWHGVDVPAMMANPAAGMAYTDLAGDTVTLKIGGGI